MGVLYKEYSETEVYDIFQNYENEFFEEINRDTHIIRYGKNMQNRLSSIDKCMILEMVHLKISEFDVGFIFEALLNGEFNDLFTNECKFSQEECEFLYNVFLNLSKINGSDYIDNVNIASLLNESHMIDEFSSDDNRVSSHNPLFNFVSLEKMNTGAHNFIQLKHESKRICFDSIMGKVVDR